MERPIDSKEGFGIIYVVTNTVNGKKYVGKTKHSLDTRKGQHIQDSKQSSFCFHKALIKYGVESFNWEVVDTAENKEELSIKEQYWITLLHTYLGDPRCMGYNMTKGGEGDNPIVYTKIIREKMSRSAKDRCTTEWKERQSKIASETFSGKTHTPEHVEKRISKIRGSHHYLYGKHPSEEARLKMSISSKGKNKKESHCHNISEALKGHKVSDETKKKISHSLSGNNHPNFGKKVSELTKEKMRASAKRGGDAKNARKVECVETGDIFNCIGDTQRIGVCPTSVSACCRGKQKTAGGFHWQYIEE